MFSFPKISDRVLQFSLQVVATALCLDKAQLTTHGKYVVSYINSLCAYKENSPHGPNLRLIKSTPCETKQIMNVEVNNYTTSKIKVDHLPDNKVVITVTK